MSQIHITEPRGYKHAQRAYKQAGVKRPVKRSPLSKISARKLSENGGKMPYSTMRARSKKKAHDDRQRRKDWEQLTGSGAYYVPCEVRSPICTGEVGCFHEPQKRSAGGSTTDQDNRVNACVQCNGYIEDHPAWAIANGWSKSRTPVLHELKMAALNA